MTTSSPPVPTTAGALADRLLDAVVGSYEVAAVALGRRLGWYRALADEGPLTAPALAARTGTDARYAREWLEQQAVAGYLAVDDGAAGPDDRRFRLPEEHSGVLVEELDPAFLAPLAEVTTAFLRWVPRLTDVYRGTRTLSWADLGDDAREAQAAANRPFFAGPLVHELLPAVPGVADALEAGGRVADVGCGYGWSSTAITARWPACMVDGFDVDGPSVDRARRHAREAGVAERTTFVAADVRELDRAGAYDLVTAFECVHDLADPVGALAAMRRMVRPGGTVLVLDEAVAEEFTAPGDLVERLMYGYSLLCCLPDGRSAGPSAATGTVLRPATLRRYAQAAGFRDVEVLPLDAGFFRVYRLV
ncbi:class I SAM-dependent methyltransferase [Modestobacter sp. NPDC049651]|uniref:class I SAM-dependent methyltransferase n=1 Tax=unclassified Modestobacter TaxID=2643866 RepID=UPI003407709D